jgi:hypothetical protein
MASGQPTGSRPPGDRRWERALLAMLDSLFNSSGIGGLTAE